jgi:hypothetical protein
MRDSVAREPVDGDWPGGGAENDAAWTATLAALDAANAELVAVVGGMDDARLEERLGDLRDPALGSGVSRYVTLHGLVQHHIYHAGQISLLKKRGK